MCDNIALYLWNVYISNFNTWSFYVSPWGVVTSPSGVLYCIWSCTFWFLLDGEYALKFVSCRFLSEEILVSLWHVFCTSTSCCYVFPESRWEKPLHINRPFNELALLEFGSSFLTYFLCFLFPLKWAKLTHQVTVYQSIPVHDPHLLIMSRAPSLLYLGTKYCTHSKRKSMLCSLITHREGSVQKSKISVPQSLLYV